MSERIIKKYPNRRLYDVKMSRHINLEEIRELVMQFEPFQVVDSKTGVDITHQILLQILIESHEKGTHSVLTKETLAQLIRMCDSPIGAGFAEYLEKLLEVYVKQREFILDQFQKSFSVFNPFGFTGTPANMEAGMWESWNKFMKTQGPGESKEAGDSPEKEEKKK